MALAVAHSERTGDGGRLNNAIIAIGVERSWANLHSASPGTLIESTSISEERSLLFLEKLSRWREESALKAVAFPRRKR